MKRVVLWALLLSLAAVSVVSAGRPIAPFIGAWENLDTVDGSHQGLTIAPGREAYRVVYRDHAATICGYDAKGRAYPLLGLGWGTAEGDVLTADIEFWCMTRRPTVLDELTVIFTYDGPTDTITDSWAQVWDRMGAR
jgi:hypothetical protein